MAKKRARRKSAAPRRPAKGRKRTPSTKRAGRRSAARSRAGRKRTATARRNTGRRTAGAKTPKGKAARRRSTNPPRAGKRRTRPRAASKRSPTPKRPGGTGREETLAQTPETGRTVRGRTNPLPTRRSTGTAAGAGNTRRVPGLERARRQLREVEESVPTPPSSLDLERGPSAARSGRAEMREARRDHTETSPVLTGGDVDADWEEAYAVGDEAPGGDNPTPDQDRVDDIGKALGVEYQDNEELRPTDKIADRDKKRWELDPASSEDYKDRD
jgi:hypothetical protein